ncbi:hypothetical protein Trydic_g9372 [Trypoxylus dichotomus]
MIIPTDLVITQECGQEDYEERTMTALLWLMPNIEVPRTSKRRPLVTVIHSQVTNVAPVWQLNLKVEPSKEEWNNWCLMKQSSKELMTMWWMQENTLMTSFRIMQLRPWTAKMKPVRQALV